MAIIADGKPPSRLGRMTLWVVLIVILGILVLIEFRTENGAIDIMVSAASGALLAGLVQLARPQRARRYFARVAEISNLPSPQALVKESSSRWQAIPPIVTPALAIAGLLIYTVVVATYQSFYSPLGVQPSDVGYSYAKTISSATGLLVYILTISAPFAIGYFVVSVCIWSYIYRRLQLPSVSLVEGLKPLRSELGLLLIVSFLIVTMFFPLVLLGPQARRASERLQAGFPQSIKSVGPFVTLELHSDPARIGPISSSKSVAKSPNEDGPSCNRVEVEALYDKPLIYLGQANGSIVVYDPECRKSIFVPQSSVVLHIYS